MQVSAIRLPAASAFNGWCGAAVRWRVEGGRECRTRPLPKTLTHVNPTPSSPRMLERGPTWAGRVNLGGAIDEPWLAWYRRHVRSFLVRRHVRGAAADRHQVQPRRRRGYPEGQGRRAIQATRRGTYEESRQGGSLPKQLAVQG